jgi:hypothetical protein
MSSIQLSAFPVTAYIQKVFGGPTVAPRTIYPHKPNRRVWNPNYPDLHTIKSAIVYIVQDSTDNGEPICAPQVNDRLVEMGFGHQLVRESVAAVLSSTEGINKVKVRYYPPDGSKSWTMYAYGWGANVIDGKSRQIASWLNTSNNRKHAIQVIQTMARMGRDYFTKENHAE